MAILRILSLALFATFSWAPYLWAANAAHLHPLHNSLEARYTRAHSLGDNYQFDPRDGWQTVNATNLQYKYSRAVDRDEGHENDEGYGNNTSRMYKRASKKTKSTSKVKSKSKAVKPKSASKSSSGNIKATVSKAIDSIKGVGKSEPVIITWYTGHDLLNPSCWSNPTWAPTDASFAAALTLEGWTNRPKCFKFLELCNTPKKCVFVRVVDSCAGCAKASKHVDLTQAAFSQLANLDQGLLKVQMRPATDPEGWWLENLWGPKV